MLRKVIVLAAAGAIVAGCTTDPFTGEQKVSNTAIGAGTGALLGTAAGLIIGQNTCASSRKAMLVGAGIGALAGGGVGLYMDNQEAKLRQRLQGSGVSVTRVGQDIVLNMPSNVTFATDSADLKPQFFETLNSVAIVLKEFNQTLVDVTGHTDSTGSPSHNQRLSERRAARWPNIWWHRATVRSASRCWAWGRRSPSRPTPRRKAGRRTAASKSASCR